MTTATQTQPPGPPPVEGATWNGAEWYVWDGNTWNKVPAAAPPPPPPPPPAAEKARTEPLPVIEDWGDYFNQPSSTGGEGRYWKYHQKPVGTTYWGIVKRPLVRTDVKPQTDAEGNVQYQNGQVRWQLEVPMLVLPDTDFADGTAMVVFKSDARDKLNAEMAAVGVEPHPAGGYLPEVGAFMQMTKVGEQSGHSKKGGFTKYIYEVVYRRPDDPWTIAKRAEVEAAHKALAEEGPPPPPPEMVYNHATKQWELKQAAATPAAPPPPPAAAPAVPPPAAPATNGSGTNAVQAAAAHVATSDANGQPPAPAPAPALAVPPPAGPPAAPAPAAAPAATNGAAVTPQITQQQWELMTPQVRAIIAQQTGQAVPAGLPVG